MCISIDGVRSALDYVVLVSEQVIEAVLVVVVDVEIIAKVDVRNEVVLRLRFSSLLSHMLVSD